MNIKEKLTLSVGVLVSLIVALVAITSPMSDWWHNNIDCDNHGLYFGLADTKSS